MERLDAEGLIAHLASLTLQERAVRLAAFRSILGGEPASAQNLSSRTSLPLEDVAHTLESLVAKGMAVLAPSGEVVASGGLSLVPTPHRLRIQGQHLYTWCAEDAVGIPAALGADAEVSSACCGCGEPIHIELKAGHLGRSTPPGVHLWLAVGEVGRSLVGCT